MEKLIKLTSNLIILIYLKPRVKISNAINSILENQLNQRVQGSNPRGEQKTNMTYKYVAFFMNISTHPFLCLSIFGIFYIFTSNPFRKPLLISNI